MDRRSSLKLIAAGALAAPLVVTSCKPEEKPVVPAEPEFSLDRNPDELKREKELLAKEAFFTPHEMQLITILADIIIPGDDISGSASEAGVPAFIEFIVKDMPGHQTPMRGGLKWMDIQSTKRFGKNFDEIYTEQQLEIVEDIAYPHLTYKDEKGNEIKTGEIKPGMEPGVAFFSLMRNLTATGFYTSPEGVKDIGYAGNVATQWNGVPADVLKQYNVSYTEKELKECVSFENPA